MAIGLLAAYHYFVHRSWMDSVTRRFVSRASGRARLYYALDLALMVGFGLMFATGLAISTWLELPLGDYAVWRDVHVQATVATVAALAVKLVLHRRWIASVGRSLWGGQVANAGRAPAGALLTPPRRQLLAAGAVVAGAGLVGAPRLIGGTGTAAADTATPTEATAQALAQAALPADRRGRGRGRWTTPAVGTSDPSGVAVAVSSAAGAATTCAVQCSHRCSYPGDCRRYVDADGNGRCDLGECA